MEENEVQDLKLTAENGTVGSPEQVPLIQQTNPTNYWGEIQSALSDGYSRQEIADYLSQSKGLSIDDADKQIVESVQSKIKAAAEDGYTEAEIKDYLVTNRYDPEIVSSALATANQEKTWKKYDFQPGQQMEEAVELSSLYQNVYGKYSTTGKQVLGFFDEKSALEARREINQLNVSTAAKLQELGLNAFISPDTGELMLKMEDGLEVPVESSMLSDLYNSKAEITGSIAGAIAGAKTGANVGTAIGTGVGLVAGNLTGVGLVLPEELVTGPVGAGVGKVVGGIAGAFVGGATGAGLGKAADLTINAVKLKENLEADLYYQQMKEAAIADGVFSVLGTGAIKLGGYGFKGIMRAYDFTLAGNSKGAYRALKDIMQISDEQAETIIKSWESHNASKLPGGNFEEKAIAAVSTTQQGGENVISYSASTNPKLASSIISSIDERAKDVVKAIDTVATEDVGKVLKEDLGKYTSDVKNYYGAVKDIAVQATKGTDFTFDLDNVALKPVMESIEKGISDPTMRERFANHALRIGNATEDRSFSGLLELRQAVNDFKYSKTKLKKPDVDALNTVLNQIDNKIAAGAKEYVSKDWLGQWTKAKSEYAKMKKLEENVLFKAVNRKGMTEENIRKFASKYIDSLDGTFDEVMDKLPKTTRSKAEAAVIKQLTDKYTLGNVTDKQAIHFPMLADALKSTNIKTAEAKQLKILVNEMANIFKNDVNLSKISGNIAVPKFQSYLTTDPVVRAKFEIASTVFNTVKRFAPGQTGRNLALVNKLDKLLENPLHAKSASEFLSQFPQELQPEVKSLMQQLQIETAKQGGKQESKDFVKMYKQSASGKFTVTNGALGKGVYLVDKVKNPTGKVISQEVNMSRLATLDNINTIFGREINPKEIRNLPNLQKELLDRGYNGIRLDDKAMLFTEQSTKKSISNEVIKD